MRESEILKSIMLELGNLPGVLIFRNNCGVLRDERGRPVKFGLAPGSADLIVLLAPFGRMIALEVKSDRKGSRMSDAQMAWQAAVRRVGCVCETVRSPSEALAVIAQARESRGCQLTLPKERT